jgi:hypothetical protein
MSIFDAELEGLTSRQRFDIAVWNEDHIVGLVEVKNAPRTNDTAFGHDIRKLRRALTLGGPARGGSLQWGVFLFSATRRRGGSAVPKMAVNAELERRLRLCQAADGESMIRKSTLVRDDDKCCLGWGAVQLSSS